MNANKFSLGKYELYSVREKIIRYFESTGAEFDLYGQLGDVQILNKKYLAIRHFNHGEGGQRTR